MSAYYEWKLYVYLGRHDKQGKVVAIESGRDKLEITAYRMITKLLEMGFTEWETRNERKEIK